MTASDYTKSTQAQRVWQALQHGDSTGAQIVARSCIAPRSLEAILRVFRACGLVHVCGWVQPPESRYVLVAVYRFGPGADLPRPRRNIRSAEVFVETSAAAHLIVATLEKSGSLGSAELAADIGIAPAYAHKLLRALLKVGGVIHVSGWNRHHSGQATAIYSAGPKQDKRRPRAKTNAEIHRARRQRLVQQYGPEIARRIQEPRKKGGPERIVVDGKTVFQRAVDRKARNQQARA